MQRIMNELFDNILGENAMIYLYDIIIFNKDSDEHIKITVDVRNRTKINNIRIDPNKIQYCENEVESLGMFIDDK